MHDIYDPPPAPIAWNPPKPERLVFTTGDLTCLALLCAVLFAAALLAWRTEPSMAMISALGGTLVILESWFTALGYLHRCPPVSLKVRWTIFLAALLPWLLGVAFAVCLMLCLFWISDHWR